MSGSYADRSAKAYKNDRGHAYGNIGGGQVYNNSAPSYNNSNGAPAYNNSNGAQGFSSSGVSQTYNSNIGQQTYGGQQVFNGQQAYNNSVSAEVHKGGVAQMYNNNPALGTQAYNNAGGAQVYNNSSGDPQTYNNVGPNQGYNSNASGPQAYNNSNTGQAYNNTDPGAAQAYNNDAHAGAQAFNNDSSVQKFNSNAGGAQVYNSDVGGSQGYHNNNQNQGYYNTQPPAPPESTPPQLPSQLPPQLPPQPPPQPPPQLPPQPPPPPPPNTYQQQQYGSPSPSNNMVGRYQQPQQSYVDSIDIEAEEQSRILSKSIARVQESSHYMRQAMERDDLPTALEKARAMLTELGDLKNSQFQQHTQQQYQTGGPHQSQTTDPSSSQSTTLSPKNYYELHTLALQELPNLEEFFLSLFRQRKYSPSQLYEIIQYCPRAVPRLYLQICVASAWIRTETEAETTEEGQPPHLPAAGSSLDRRWLLLDLKGSVRCVQCPIRGLFLRYYLLQALKDKLPDSTKEQSVTPTPEPDPEPEPAPTEPQEEGSILRKNANLGGLLQNESPSSGFLDNDEEKSKNDNLGALLQNPSPSGGFLNNDEEIHEKMESVNINAPNASTAPNPNVNSAVPHDPNSATVQDSYEFILSNLIEMNKLWVRIQHMPGDQRTKAARKKRERERNELRVLVGTNIVRLSELNEVTSAIYGTVILPRILDQIVVCRDPLAQAYLMDCMIQVFPDEFHIQTLEIILGVCPRLREKVNIRTILQGIMDRFVTYYADELLLGDEEDTEGVKTSVMLDTFEMFEDCIASVLEAKASRVTARELIRLESSLLEFSLKCYPGNTNNVNKCLMICAAGLRGEMGRESGGSPTGGGANSGRPIPIELDEVAVVELEKLLSLPLETLALRVLELDHYSELLAFLPSSNRKLVAVNMLKAVKSSGQTPMNLNEIEQLFSIVQPLLHKEQQDQRMGLVLNNPPVTNNTEYVEHLSLVAKLLHSLYHEDTDSHYEMLCVAKKYLPINERASCGCIAPPLVFAALKLIIRIRSVEYPTAPSSEQNVGEESQKEDLGSHEDNIAVEEQKDESDCEAETTATDGPEDTIATDEVVTNDLGEECTAQNTNVTEVKGEESSVNGDIKENKEENQTKEVDSSEGTKEKNKVLSCQDEVKNLIDEEKNEGMFQDDISNPSPQLVSAFSKQTNCRKVFLFIQRTLAAVKQSSPDTCLILALRAATAADCCAVASNESGNSNGELNLVAHEFMTQALSLYETEIKDSQYQPRAITSMVGTLLSIRCLTNIEYEALITKTTQYAARLMKKTDQCKMVLLCSHLFFNNAEDGAYQNPSRVLECLQRALKIADACTAASASNLQLFVDILEQYIYFYEKQNPVITDRFITGLIALINEHIGNIGTKSTLIVNAQCQFYKIIEYIKEKQTQTQSSERFQPIDC